MEFIPKIQAATNITKKTHLVFVYDGMITKYKWDKGTGRRLRGIEEGLPLDQIRAAVNHPKKSHKGYFFTANQYYRVNWETDKVDSGYPKPISNWEGLPDRIDAIVVKPSDSNRLYFFSDENYYRWSWEDNQVDSGYPKRIEDHWPGLPSGSDIDAIVNHPNKNSKSFFFCGTKYYRWDWETDQVDTGYPRVTADNWSLAPNPSHWMKYVDDTTLVSGLSIPGTHDSCTYSIDSDLLGYGRCQGESTTIERQLELGCRYLDLRGGVEGDTIQMYHADAHCNTTLLEVFESCAKFLRENKEETIFAQIKQEGPRRVPSPSYASALEDEMARSSAHFYSFDRIPTMGEVRGRIILVNRFSNSRGAAITKPGQSGTVFFFSEDLYHRYDTAESRVAATHKLSKGFPKRDKDNWKGIPSKLDAAVERPGKSQKIYFFSGENYYRYNFKHDTLDAGYPRKISSGWSGLPSRIDAAVGKPGDDNKIYFFAGDEYYRFDFDDDQVDSGYPKKITTHWKGLPSKIDAAVPDPKDKDELFFFSGDQYYRYNTTNDKVDSGYPRKISSGWEGLPSRIDAAVGKPGGSDKIFLFSGDQYYRFDWHDDKVDSDYPKLTSHGTRLPPNIDAVVNSPGDTNKSYFFSGKDYYRFDWRHRRVDRSYPKSTSNWTGLPPYIDAATNSPSDSNKLYFFSGDEYYRYDWEDDKVDAGYPKKITDHWAGLPPGVDVALGGVRDGKIYFFVGDKYYRYDFSDNRVDAGYPKKIKHHWAGLPFPLTARGINTAEWDDNTTFSYTNASGVTYRVQDHYSIIAPFNPRDVKMSHILEFFQDYSDQPEHLCVNFLSATLALNPKDFATGGNGINERVLTEILDQEPFDSNRWYGIVLLDFFNDRPTTVNRIIGNNFQD